MDAAHEVSPLAIVEPSGLRACMLGLAMLILVTSCAAPPPPTTGSPTPTQKPATIPPASKPPTSRPTATATRTRVPFEAVMPAGARLFDAHESILRFDFNQAALEQKGDFLLVLGEEPYQDLPDGGEITLDLLGWEGSRGAVLRIGYEGTETIKLDVGSRNGQPSSSVLLKMLVSFSTRDLYVIDLEEASIFGLKHGCEMLRDAVISDWYLAFSCFEPGSEWYFLPLAAPEQVIVWSLADAADDPMRLSPPLIRGDLALFYPDLGDQACMINIREGQPVCRDVPLWLGPLSPDGKWFEVRRGYESAPDETGIMASNCLLQQNIDCVTLLTTTPPDMAPFDSDRILGDSAWDPLSEAIFYVVHIDTVWTNYEREESEIWRYDLMSQRFEKLSGPLQGVLYFGDGWFRYPSPAPWSPDGRYVAMKEIGGGIYKLEVETGELTLLSEGGVLLGSVHLE